MVKPAANSRHTGQAATALLRQAFELRRDWTPAQLRTHCGLTRYQAKAALRRLLEDGCIQVSGRTRGAIYRRVRLTECADVQRIYA